MQSRFAIPLALLSGVLLGAVLVGVAGILAIQKVGMQAGIVIDPFSNEVVAVTNPQQPFLPMLATAVLGALVAYPLLRAASHRSLIIRLALIASFAVTVIALITWGLIVGPPSGAIGDLRAIGNLGTGGIAPGFQGWIENGSKASAVHVVFILALGSLLVHPRRDAGTRASAMGNPRTR